MYKRQGLINAIKNEDINLLATPITPNFWRAPVDNDFGHSMPEKCKTWRYAGQNTILEAIKFSENQPLMLFQKPDKTYGRKELTVLMVESQLSLPNIQANFKLNYTLHEDGSLHIHYNFFRPPCEPNLSILPEIPRIGLHFHLNPTLKNINWVGRGPFENYPDRKHAAHIGRYDSTVREMYEAYISPQENGNRSDVQKVAFYDKIGAGLLVTGMDFNFTAIPFSPEELTRDKWGALHTYDLKDEGKISVCLDHQQRGLGLSLIHIDAADDS